MEDVVQMKEKLTDDTKKEEKSELQFKIILSLADDKIKNLIKCVLEELIDYQLQIGLGSKSFLFQLQLIY